MNKTTSPSLEATEMDNTIKSSSIGTSKIKSNSKWMTNEEHMRMWQQAITGLGNVDMKYLDQDQDGVIISYLCQFEGAKVERLGVGRCGTMKKINWNSGFAAMKDEYVVHQQHDDDERIPSALWVCTT